MATLEPYSLPTTEREIWLSITAIKRCWHFTSVCWINCLVKSSTCCCLMASQLQILLTYITDCTFCLKIFFFYKIRIFLLLCLQNKAQELVASEVCVKSFHCNCVFVSLQREDPSEFNYMSSKRHWWKQAVELNHFIAGVGHFQCTTPSLPTLLCVF